MATDGEDRPEERLEGATRVSFLADERKTLAELVSTFVLTEASKQERTEALNTLVVGLSRVLLLSSSPLSPPSPLSRPPLLFST